MKKQALQIFVVSLVWIVFFLFKTILCVNHRIIFDSFQLALVLL